MSARGSAAGGRAVRLERLLEDAEALAQIGSWELDLRTGETLWSAGLRRLLGVAPDDAGRDREAVLSFVHPEDRERVDRLLTTVGEDPGSLPEEGVAAELRVVRADGAVREVRARVRIEHDEHSRPVRWVGTLQDVTDQRLAERELRAHYAVSQALRDWETFEEGVVDLLRRVGTALEYPMGSLWLWADDRGALACRAFWHAPDVDPEGFESAKRQMLFRPGEGKPGQAWERREPVVTADMEHDPVFRPREAAVMRGLRSGVAFPAVDAAGDPVAVLSFYSFERRVPSASLVRTLTGIGRELGRFLARRRAQLGPRPLTDREIEVLRLAAGGRSGPDIAEELVLSPSTVKTHFENIYDKLGVSDRASAVAFALRGGLIS